MEPGRPAEARKASPLNPGAKSATTNILGAIAFCKEPSRKLLQAVQRKMGLDVNSSPIHTDASGLDGRGKINSVYAPSVELSMAIPFFKSHCDLGTAHSSAPAPAFNEAFAVVTDYKLKACILKEGILFIFSNFLVVAFCIVTVTIPSAELLLVKRHGEHVQPYAGSDCAIRLYGLLLATCLCMLGFAWLGDCTQSREYNGCHGEVEMSINRAQEAEQKAYQACRAKQQFMTYVFHNLRVPFNAIVLGLGHLRMKADKGLLSSEITETADLIEMMLDCAETMTSVLDDVTDMDQWEDGVMELNLEEFDLLGVVKFLLWGLKDLLYQKQMCFSISIDPIAKAVLSSNHVRGDKHRVLQTLGNFLSNAVKFSPAGGKLEMGIKCEELIQRDTSFPCKTGVLHNAASNRAQDCLLCARLREESTRKNSMDPLKPHPFCTGCGQGSFAKVLITVKDMGNGISGEDQAKLFELNSFVSSGWVQKAGVSGLGLSMAKRFVEQSGGYIGVDSKEREGNMFYFCLPYSLIPIAHGVEYELPSKDEWLDAFMMEDSEGSQDRRSNFRKRETIVRREERAVAIPLAVDEGRRKVLLVEDTEINRIILRKVLQNLNLSCEEAENGQVAVDFFKQGRTYDLILMDKEMPVMDGHEATRQLRLMGVKTPIVALTGNSLQEDKDLFLEAGVDDFQTKPLSRDKLVQVLARFGVEIPRG